MLRRPPLVRRRSARFDESAFAIVDLETTGFDATRDAIVEISVVHVDPGGAPMRVAFDSLVDPQRSIAGTHIHGIRARDVLGAPTFREIAGDLLRVLAGRVLVGHNFSFDWTFLSRSLRAVGVDARLPYVCTMYMRPLLGLGPKLLLDEACREVGITRRSAHAAGADALDTAALWQWQLEFLRRARIATFGGLARRGDYAFVRSWTHPVLPPDVGEGMPGCEQHGRIGAFAGTSHRHRVYFEALASALMDLEITPAEAAHLAELRRSLGFELDDVRALHAQAFAGAILVLAGDQKIDEHDSTYLRRLSGCLSELGWSPGK